jgi:hypothetical protein
VQKVKALRDDAHTTVWLLDWLRPSPCTDGSDIFCAVHKKRLIGPNAASISLPYCSAAIGFAAGFSPGDPPLQSQMAFIGFKETDHESKVN